MDRLNLALGIGGYVIVGLAISSVLAYWRGTKIDPEDRYRHEDNCIICGYLPYFAAMVLWPAVLAGLAIFYLFINPVAKVIKVASKAGMYSKMPPLHSREEEEAKTKPYNYYRQKG